MVVAFIVNANDQTLLTVPIIMAPIVVVILTAPVAVVLIHFVQQSLILDALPRRTNVMETGNVKVAVVRRNNAKRMTHFALAVSSKDIDGKNSAYFI